MRRNALTERHLKQWHKTGSPFPRLDRAYTPAEQAVRENRFETLAGFLDEKLRRLPSTPQERGRFEREALARCAEFASNVLDLDDAQVRLLFGGPYTAVAREMVDLARAFDPHVSAADIYQAGRNAMTAGGIQSLLGLEIRLTPGIFAYSMLYPYTDNYLDDPRVPPAAKRAFNRRLRRRLSGEPVTPADPREQKVYELLAIIENDFDRDAYPQVLAGLLSIHQAQVRSLLLHKRCGSPSNGDLLRISLEKGGASVLADAYLVAPALGEEEAACLFGWGVLLQLGDDLQDIESDRAAGIRTIFSEQAGRESLDGLTNRLFEFGRILLAHMEIFASPSADAIKDLIRRSFAGLLVAAAGAAPGYFSRAYLRALEAYSPFRFSFMRRHRKKFLARQGMFRRLISATLSKTGRRCPSPSTLGRFPLPRPLAPPLE